MKTGMVITTICASFGVLALAAPRADESKNTAAPQTQAAPQAAATVKPEAGRPEPPSMFGGTWSRNMVSDEKGLPEKWDVKTGLNIKWSATLGSQSYAGPVLHGGKVFVGTNNEGMRNPKLKNDRGVLMVFDMKDGKFLWQAAHPKLSAGMVNGVIFNDAGKGFMHKSRVDCALMNDVNQGKANAKGTCVVTDADGDKIFLEWKCTGTMPACPGDEKFVGGTGKYTGITGDQKFQGNFIGTTGGGWSDWNGEYKLP